MFAWQKLELLGIWEFDRRSRMKDLSLISLEILHCQLVEFVVGTNDLYSGCVAILAVHRANEAV